MIAAFISRRLAFASIITAMTALPLAAQVGGDIDIVPEKVAAFLLLGADYRLNEGKFTTIREKPLTFKKFSGEVVTVLAEDNCTYKVQTYNTKEEVLFEERYDFTKLRKIALNDTGLGVWALGGKSQPRFHCWSRKPNEGTLKTGCFESLTSDPEDIYVEADGNADPKDVYRAYRLFVGNICRIPQ